MTRWIHFMLFFLLLNIYLVNCKGGRGSSGGKGSSRGSSGSRKSSTSTSGQQNSGVHFGWQNPSRHVSGPRYKSTNSQSSSNIGPYGYPDHKPPRVNDSPFDAKNYFALNNGHAKIVTPTYPKKKLINNQQPLNTPSQYGMSSSYYPKQNNFGYPGGFYGNNLASYGGMGLFSSGGGGYGYSGGGRWGGYPSYGSKSGMGSTAKGLLMGAAGGYLAGSLVNRLSNPWNYQGYGYGYNYYDLYRQIDRRPEPPTPTPTPIVWNRCVEVDPATNETLINSKCSCHESFIKGIPGLSIDLTVYDCFPKILTNSFGGSDQSLTMNATSGAGNTSEVSNSVSRPESTTLAPASLNNQTMYWKECFGMDPATNETIVNPNCSCSVSITTSQVTGLNTTTQNCIPKSQSHIQTVPSNEVNSVDFNGTVGGDDTTGLKAPSAGQSGTPVETSTPQTEPLVGESIALKRMEFYSHLEKIVNMGHFGR